jgi:hypothetical protein
MHVSIDGFYQQRLLATHQTTPSAKLLIGAATDSSSPPALIEAHRAAVSPSTKERVTLQASTLARVALNFSMAAGKFAVLLSSLTPK